MEVVIRPVGRRGYEAAKTDAVSCTYNMDGFTPMNGVLIQLGLDREHFRKCEHMHADKEFRVILHGDEKPYLITTTKTERWDSEPSATEQILNTADAERCESLRLTHFAFILGEFPTGAFSQCLRQVEQAKHQTNLKKILVDIDDRYVEVAKAAYKKLQAEVVEAAKS
jgi:hypothetical protein